jgi:hypothetical protein
VLPSVKVPLSAIVRSRPELDVRVPVDAPPTTLKLRSLRFWATSVGLLWRFVRTIETVFADVVKVAWALTGPPPADEPVGVTKVIEAAPADGIDDPPIRVAIAAIANDLVISRNSIK